jgi:hypothetical protein
MTRPAGYLIRTPAGLEGERGIFYNYILGGNGLFIQAKSAHLAATVCIAPQEVRGLLPVEDSIVLLHGHIPLNFLNLCISVMCIKPELEQYIAIVWDGKDYSIRIPDQMQNPGSVTYQTLDNTVLAIHSHVQGVLAEFSGIDDHDDSGFGLFAVVGDLITLCPTVKIRIGIYGYFIDVEKEFVFKT